VDQLELMVDLPAINSGHHKKVYLELQKIEKIIDNRAKLKLVLPDNELDQKAIIKACELIRGAGVDLVKIIKIKNFNNDFLQMVRELVLANLKVEISAHLLNQQQIREILRLGVDRLSLDEASLDLLQSATVYVASKNDN
jgi:deoxyribose-phosphate aldolase